MPLCVVAEDTTLSNKLNWNTANANLFGAVRLLAKGVITLLGLVYASKFIVYYIVYSHIY